MHPYLERLAREAAAAEGVADEADAKPLTATPDAPYMYTVLTAFDYVGSPDLPPMPNARTATGAGIVPPLTVADVLKRSTTYCLTDHHVYLIYYSKGGNGVYQVWHLAKKTFESSDESAACAEFLRLTGGGE